MQQILHSSAKLIASDSDIDKAFGSMHQSITRKIKNYPSKDWINKTIVEHGVKVFEC